ncbi:unnamed protein product [Dracunculus medinensis]|uniref:Ion_trans_2 domain-containing protein n=1 Tax=Dracunculus medinensis TaxID=318479 RepID=A0A158Q5L9_DRAME|nr:unnamed protein product [Dracunculus medinensis]
MKKNINHLSYHSLVLLFLQILAHWTSSRSHTVRSIMDCLHRDTDELSQWNYITATLFGFGVVTTLGYNKIGPITTTGRIFCICYGLIGIPITMIIIANIGQHLNHLVRILRLKIENFCKKTTKVEDDLEASTEIASLVLLVVFLVYVALGALFLPLLNGEYDFLNGLYYNFLCLTAIDFGQLVPRRMIFLPITFIYVCIGLAITTIAIEVGSDYLKRFHNLGQKIKDVAATKVWFGGKQVKVRDLLHIVGEKCGVEPALIDAIDLDNVVTQAIAVQYLVTSNNIEQIIYEFGQQVEHDQSPLVDVILKKPPSLSSSPSVSSKQPSINPSTMPPLSQNQYSRIFCHRPHRCTIHRRKTILWN